MSEQHHDPGGTPEPGSDSLTRTPSTTDQHHAGTAGQPEVTPGVYQADDAEKERGRAVKPGN